MQRDTRALSMWDDDQARKGEITARMNERDHPHVVEPALPSGGFRPSSDEMQAFHRERGVESRARAAAALLAFPELKVHPLSSRLTARACLA